MNQKAYSFAHRQCVEIHDTDLAGFVHFSNYYAFMERAEAAFFDSIGFPLVIKEAGQFYGWPKVRSKCTHFEPLRFRDHFEVQLSLLEIKLKALHYGFRFHRLDPDSGSLGTLVAKGELHTVFSVFPLNEAQDVRSAAIPEDLLKALEARRVSH